MKDDIIKREVVSKPGACLRVEHITMSKEFHARITHALKYGKAAAYLPLDNPTPEKQEEKR